MSKFNWVAKACGIFLLWTVTAIALPAQTFTRLHLFDGTDGSSPRGLVQGANGYLYGITAYGGTTDENAGTVFGMATSGGFKSLYDFCPQSGCPDGENPQGALIQATDGNFYGTTLYGGTNDSCVGGLGCGSAFKISATGQFTPLHSFCSQSNCADGNFPPAGLVLGLDGSLYGVTESGGPTAGCPNGCGTVFKITTAGQLTTLYDFCSESSCLDGVDPDAGLLLGTDGNFYGSTTGGGNAGRGVVFKITPAGALTVLYSLCTVGNCADGISPEATLAQGSDGNFYGSTTAGGANSRGTIFQLTPTGQLTTLYNFCSQGGNECTDGYGSSGLIQATDANFYGTTEAAGGNGEGTIYKIISSGAFTTLYNFCSKTDCADGATPFAGVIQDTNGTLYGTTSTDGVTGGGIAFSFAVGLGPFVETLPVAAKVGATIGILGTNLTSPMSVTFNGTTASFKLVSASLIEAKVPSGATTGIVQVQLRSGTLSSNKPFIVLP